MTEQRATAPSVRGASRQRAVLGIVGMLLASPLTGGCALTNIGADSCESDDPCREAFGLGSQCVDGYCSQPAGCDTGHDCRRWFGGGACVDSLCQNTLPSHPLCTLTEPVDLATRPLTGSNAPLVVGSILGLGDSFDEAQSAAIRLGVREINDVSGLMEGQPLGIVVCDSGGPDDTADGEERQQLNRTTLDYLSGTLGVPFLVGPTRSTDSFTLVSHAVASGYPTVIISPAATSPQLASEPDKLSPDDPFGLFWRTCPNDELQGSVLAGEVVGQLPTPIADFNKVAIVYNDDTYGEGLANVFQTAWDGAPSHSSVRFPFDSDSDWSSLAGNIMIEDPNGVLIIAVMADDTIHILSAIAESGWPNLGGARFYLTDASKDSAALFADGLSPQTQAIIANQTIGTAPAVPDSTEFSSFSASLNKDFGFQGTDVAFLANSYDALFVGAYGAIWARSQHSGFDGRLVAEGLSRLITGNLVHTGKSDWSTAKSGLTSGNGEIDVEGISGPLDFDPTRGEAPAPIEVWEPANGGFNTIYTVDP